MRTLGYIPAAAAALAIAAGSMTATAAGNDKAADVLAATRKAIGQKKLDSLETFSMEAKVQRNVGNFQLSSEVELLLELPDKYVRSDATSGGPINFSSVTGFNGDRALLRANAPGMGGGGTMVVRMGPGGAAMPPGGEKPTPEQQEQMNAMAVRSARQDLSRLTLGWFGTAIPSLGVEYTFAGEAESPDGKAYVIDAKNADGFAARLFIDEQSNLPLMVVYQGPQPRVFTSGRAGGPGAPGQQVRQMTDEDRQKMREELEKLRTEPPTLVEHRLYFDDWREVDGIRFPHRIQRAVGGTTEEEWSVSKVKVNPRIDPRKFQVEG